MIAVLVALAVAGSSQPSSAQDSTRRLSVHEVRVLCTQPITDRDSALAAVRAFCDWRVPTTGGPADWDVSRFRGLANATIDFLPMGVEVAMDTTPAHHLGLTAPPAVAAQPTTAAPTSWSSAILWGTTDFVIGRAQLQFQTWVLPRLTRRVCDVKYLLSPTKTCLVLGDTSTAWTAGSGGVLARIAAAARADFEALPARLDSLLAKAFSTASDSALRNSASLFRQIMRSVVAGDDLDRAFADLMRTQASGHSVDLSAGTEVGLKTYVFNALRANPRWTPDEQTRQLLARQARIGGAYDRVRALVVASSLSAALADGPVLAARRAQIADAVWQVSTAIGAPAPDSRRAASNLDAARTDAGASRLHDAVRTIAASVTAGNFWQAISGLTELLADTAVVRVLGEKPKDAGTVADLLGRLAFLADLAQSPSPEAVRSALMTYAAPPATFLTKRSRGGWTAYLNAYLGGVGGVEGVRQNDDWVRRSAVAAPYLPVGVEIDGLHLGGGWTLGLLVQVVDLGALASWRFQGDSVSRSPEVGFTQVFSPGAYVLLHVPGGPVTFGAGVAYTPSLRTFGSTDVIARRFGAFLAFDVPLFVLRVH